MKPILCIDPDIFGRESDEGRVVDGRLLCAECIERREGDEKARSVFDAMHAAANKAADEYKTKAEECAKNNETNDALYNLGKWIAATNAADAAYKAGFEVLYGKS
jgi:hypothetical protein